MKSKLNKFLILILAILIFSQPTILVLGQEISPSPLPAPSAEICTPIPAPTSPVSETAPETPPVLSISTDKESSETEDITEDINIIREREKRISSALTPTPSPSELVSLDQELISKTNSGTVIEGQNDILIQTGDALNSSSLIVTGNENFLETGKNDLNEISSESKISQNENATAENAISEKSDLNLSTQTGGNSASYNTGDSIIVTGDANTSGTAIIAANTNIKGLAVAEVNVTGERKEDIILDFSENNLTEINAFVNSENLAEAENNVFLSADSGANLANNNTKGDSTIETGDANVSASVINFLNNNVDGNVFLGVVNIFGTMEGDIILPANIVNEPIIKDNSAQKISEQNNASEIENNLNLAAATGENLASNNTGGQSNIETGSAAVEAQTVNIANLNLNSGEDWWLVIINEAGKWIGKIIGAPEGNKAAGSEFAIGKDGEIIAGEPVNSKTQENNEAKIVNNINLSANTGKNSASNNTGGNSNIKTGDAKVIANLINFVNNNVTGGGKLIVAIVNVFGKWIGNFLPFGPQENENEDPNVDNGIGEEEGEVPPETTNGNEENKAIEEENFPEEIEEDTLVLEELFDYEIIPTQPPLLAKRPSGYGEILGIQPPDKEMEFELTENDQNAPLASRRIKINLAWLILTVPIFLVSTVLKKKLFYH